jgi:hypothetical protein
LTALSSRTKIRRIYLVPTAATIRLQIEAKLARKIPSALTSVPRVIRPVVPTGVSDVDVLLAGGLPVGAITEMTGMESTGRTGIALSFLRHLVHAGRVCAWVDVSDMLSPEAFSDTIRLSANTVHQRRNAEPPPLRIDEHLMDFLKRRQDFAHVIGLVWNPIRRLTSAWGSHPTRRSSLLVPENRFGRRWVMINRLRSVKSTVER